jgi:hypothetical protein
MLRPPQTLVSSTGNKVELLEHEIVREKVATLARIGAKLRDALDALATFDREHREGEDRRAERDELVAAAGEALWYYVIQREVCGMRDNEAVLREWGVPREVRLRMGMRRTGQGS